MGRREMQNLQEINAKPGNLPKKNRGISEEKQGSERRHNRKSAAGCEAAQSPLPEKDDVIIVCVRKRHAKSPARSPPGLPAQFHQIMLYDTFDVTTQQKSGRVLVRHDRKSWREILAHARRYQ